MKVWVRRSVVSTIRLGKLEIIRNLDSWFQWSGSNESLTEVKWAGKRDKDIEPTEQTTFHEICYKEYIQLSLQSPSTALHFLQPTTHCHLFFVPLQMLHIFFMRYFSLPFAHYAPPSYYRVLSKQLSTLYDSEEVGGVRTADLIHMWNMVTFVLKLLELIMWRHSLQVPLFLQDLIFHSPWSTCNFHNCMHHVLYLFRAWY